MTRTKPQLTKLSVGYSDSLPNLSKKEHGSTERKVKFFLVAHFDNGLERYDHEHVTVTTKDPDFTAAIMAVTWGNDTDIEFARNVLREHADK